MLITKRRRVVFKFVSRWGLFDLDSPLRKLCLHLFAGPGLPKELLESVQVDWEMPVTPSDKREFRILYVCFVAGTWIVDFSCFGT